MQLRRLCAIGAATIMLTIGVATADPLPAQLGQCGNTTIKDVTTRLQDGVTKEPMPGSGSAVDFTNGGDIRGVVRGTNEFLKLANDDTKVVVGHGPLAKKANVVEYNAMAKLVRERVEKLFRDGKTESEVLSANPLQDLNPAWAADDQAAMNFLKQVYNSFQRS